MSSNNYWTGKGKHWDIPDSEIGVVGIRRINENIWFRDQQGFLRWLASSEYGRSLLHIPSHYGKIVAVRKNSITADEGGGVFRSDFRPGAKWGNLMRYQWKEVQEAYRVYERERFSRFAWRPSLVPVAPSFQYAYTTSTFYPDPHTETTSVDGRVYYAATTTFSALQSGAGNGAIDNDTDDTHFGINAHSGSPNFTILQRSVYGFDTSAIDDTDSISDAVLSLFITSYDNQFAEGQSLCLDRNPPASATALANSDYDVGGWDVVEQCTRLAYSSYSTGAYNDLTLNATGIGNIDKTGVSWFGGRVSCDFDNTSPTWSASKLARTFARYADYTGTTNDPKLVVTHAAGGGGTAIKDIISMGLLFPR